MIKYCNKSQMEQLQLYIDYLSSGITNGKFSFFYKQYNEETGKPCLKYYASYIPNQDTKIINTILKHAHTDSYATCNVLKQDSRDRKASSIVGINQLYIDIDVLHGCKDKNKLSNREYYIEKIYHRIMDLINTKTIPEPSMFIHSGRGLALYYKYDTVISTNDRESLYLHDIAYSQILNQLSVLLNTEDLKDTEFEVDTKIRNYDRIARIPTTMNVAGGKAARLIFINKNIYNQEKLYSGFGLDIHLLRETAKSLYYALLEKKVKINKRKKETAKVINIRTHSHATYVEEFKPDYNKVDFITTPLWNSANYILSCLDKYYADIEWVEGKHRERFIFIYYNCAKIVFGSEYAYEKCMELNSNMKEPLSEYELKSSMLYTENHVEYTELHSSGVYTFNPETVIGPKWLDITPEKGLQYGFLKYKKIKEDRKKYLDISIERDKLVAKLYLSGITGLRTIAKKVIEEIPDAKCSHNTVRNIINRLKLNTENLKYEDILFEENRIYTKEDNKKQELGVQTFIKLENCDMKNEDFHDDNIMNLEENGCSETEELLFVNSKMETLYRMNIEKDNHTDNWEYEKTLELLLNTKQNLFITGNGGTGKTKLINEYLDSLSKDELKRVSCCSFTGKASSNLRNGKTIHNLFRLQPDLYLPNDVVTFCVSELREIDTLIIDEIGQVRVDLFHQIMAIIEGMKEQYNHHIRVIVLGDFGQIQPVCNSQEASQLLNAYSGLYAFNSEYWNKMNFTKIVLRNILRQNDKELINKLNALKFGCLSSLHWFNNILDKTASNTAIYICPTNEKVDYYNNLKADTFKNKKEYDPILVSDNPNIIQWNKTLSLAVGMRIMTTMNTKTYKNGELGTITKLYKNGIQVKMDNGNLITINRKEQQIGPIRYKQLPIKLAFAITADKAQGMTFDEVNIIPGYFNIGQLYTVLTRCKTREGMHLIQKFEDKELKINEEALLFAI